MSSRLDRSWTVITSIDNPEHDRCVDVFARPDGSFGFEEFRRDVEDCGAWTPVQFYAGVEYSAAGEALAAAERNVAWLSLALAEKQHLRELVVSCGPSPQFPAAFPGAYVPPDAASADLLLPVLSPK